MESRLKKQLAFIKARAEKLRDVYAASRDRFLDEIGPPVLLAEAVPGGEEAKRDADPFYLVSTVDEDIAAGTSEVLAGFRRVTERPVRLEFPDDMFIAKPEYVVRPEDTCFFDIETTGLVPNTYVFLCGFMVVENGAFVVRQVLARDYAEEAGLLRYTGEMLTRYSTWITYNGESFDVPFVKTRMAVGRVDFTAPAQHLDLLGPARRAFRGVLPNNKLTTIERHLTGLRRHGDIAGRDIPVAYHEFVRSGDARRIRRVLYHNRMDLIAMAHLIQRLAHPC